MKNIYYNTIAILFLALFIMNSCIENDIPYPHIEAQIKSITADGMIAPPSIDYTTRMVQLVLCDTVDISKVNITDVVLTQGTIAHPSIVGVHNLSLPQTFILTIYQDYEWTVTAKQNIERQFVVAGQIGDAEIDVEKKYIRVYVSEKIDLSDVDITILRLGPEGITTYTPSVESLRDFSGGGLSVTVQYHSVREDWMLYVEHTKRNVELTHVDSWTRVAWLYGEGLATNENYFEIREKSTTEWSAVPREYMVKQGSEFVARVVHLSPNTTYVVRAIAGKEVSNEVTFTTDVETILPNGSMDNWWLDGRVWSPWLDGGVMWWDTGNRGVALLSESNTVPTDDAVSGRAAMMQTRFVGVLGIGKLAAGSIYAGSFGNVQGMNAVLYMGRPFDKRPTRLRGFYKYNPGVVNYATTEFSHLIGKPDSMSIFIALGDWNSPVEIRTNPNNRKLFDVNDSHIIAYKAFYNGEKSVEYVPFELELDYRSTSRVPSYLVITLSSSKYGDYFTGSTGSVLYIDELSLDWDY